MQEQNLPTPVQPERAPEPIKPASVESSPGKASTPETTTTNPETIRGAVDAASQAAPVMPATNLPQSVVADTQSNSSDGTTDTPAVADDIDVIEKAWVDKAKSIVEETKHDPYEQENQVSNLKTDYKGKRYGKTADQQI